ncbi:glycosyltransferase family 2 protein [Magnetospirillum sp. UT-4]|uniref:glycosyltransferase family 2 protein n=1 Tax=Magnetospirillum sp. UT-4 TaxID=2681467 RepID=UPI00137FE556|nr:glycosyltransferase family 2 protein [Magnetospirillum sp. UT-4]CAA7612126.1 Glycosyl transferase, family 2 [Magnetospirillum sp. UT-4]
MISVVIPALNEEQTVAATVETAAAILRDADLPCEIIVVDDASSDRTAELARTAGARVVSHVANMGYGRSLKDGILAASHDIIVITDADGTYPIAKIPSLVRGLDAGYDMVVGQRTGRAYRGSVIKSPLRWLLKNLTEFTCGQEIPDINSGLRAFRRSAVLPYLARLCNTFSFTTSLTLAFLMNGKSVLHLPVSYDERIGSTSKVRLLRDSLRTMQYIVEAVTYYNPLKIFMLISVCCLLVSFSGFVFAALSKFLAVYVLAIGMALMSVLVFALGLLAVLLKQIMDGKTGG